MLYPSLNQPIVFIVLFCGGILAGITFLLCKICVKNLEKHKFLAQICYFFTILICFFIFSAFNLLANYGQFRLFAILSFLLGMICFDFLAKFLWTKGKEKWYNLKDGRKTKKDKEAKS